MANRTMKDLWNYMGQMINTKTVYANGKWGQFDSQGRQQFDCVCAIKAYGWGVPLGKDITSNQYTYIANNKTEVPDESIANIYAKATTKSTNMSTVPTDRPYLVYMDNGHIGVAYHGRVREMCGGSVMDARETDLKSQKWNKWSNLYWAEESVDVVQVVGYLDVASYNNNVLTCAGWAYANGGSQQVTVKLYKNNAMVNSFLVTANLTRTDVKAAMGYATDKVGYILNQTLSLPDGTYEIKAYVGTSQLTNTKTFTVKNVATLTATSYPNYPANAGQYYRVRKSFTDAKSSQGSYWQWKGAFDRWNLWKSQGYHIYDNNGKQLDTEPVKTTTTSSTQTQTAQITQNTKPTLTNKSYPDYTGNKHYYVQKKFKSWLGSKGAFRSWVNAFNAWSKNKDKGYHIYDNDGKQLD